MDKRIGIIGAGAVGTAVGLVLLENGYEITGIYDKRPESTKRFEQVKLGISCATAEEVSRSADILMIATPDGAIENVVAELAELKAFHKNQAVFHLSGALSSESLNKAKKMGAIGLSIHPLQTFADVEQAICNIPGSMFSIEGDAEGHAIAIAIVEALDGRYFIIDSQAKPLYHAGACVVSNYLVTLAAFGVGLLNSAGVDKQTALQAYLPLIKGTVNNLQNVGLPGALTGPIARGDFDTVTTHLQNIERLSKDLASLYCWLGYMTAEIAEEKGSISTEQTNKWKTEFFEKINSLNSK